MRCERGMRRSSSGLSSGRKSIWPGRQTVRCMRLALASVAAFLVFAAPASADVLVNAPKKVISCGDTIELGVWYRDHPTTGHRRTTVEVRSARGVVLFKRTLNAPPEWKFW